MKDILFNRQHLREYLTYGIIAAIAFAIPVWIFFFIKDYNYLGLLFVGSILFFFVIMAYAYKLSSRRPEYKSAWMMIKAAHLATFAGVAFSVILSTLLCLIYIPGFLSGNSNNVIDDSPLGLNNQNWSFLGLLYICATVANLGVGGFIGVLGPYVFKRNQTKDKTTPQARESEDRVERRKMYRPVR